ncbi:hypothetical protein AcW1_007234 [Taiwanofungus camphoratus]|nr:hypothetical protein AcW2_007699 [Antrodia cinnamomea]KAI0952868.1 hypothetical protein AcW1_007234 [Antrodia cinnamomea]
MAYIVLVLCALAAVHAAAKNITIDDQYGDLVADMLPIYSPSGAWVQGDNCDGCALKPNEVYAYNNTWHDSTYLAVVSGYPTATLLFSGTAIYVYFIIINQAPNATGIQVNTDVYFTLDGASLGHFTNTPSVGSSIRFTYDYLVFATESLNYTAHELIMQSRAVALFDYAVYTVPDPDTASSTASSSTTISLSSTTSRTPTIPTSATASLATAAPPSPSTSTHHAAVGAIVGGVVGGLAGLAILLFLLLAWRQRGKLLFINRAPRDRVSLTASEPKSAEDALPAPAEAGWSPQDALHPFVVSQIEHNPTDVAPSPRPSCEPTNATKSGTTPLQSTNSQDTLPLGQATQVQNLELQNIVERLQALERDVRGYDALLPDYQSVQGPESPVSLRSSQGDDSGRP